MMFLSIGIYKKVISEKYEKKIVFIICNTPDYAGGVFAGKVSDSGYRTE